MSALFRKSEMWNAKFFTQFSHRRKNFLLCAQMIFFFFFFGKTLARLLRMWVLTLIWNFEPNLWWIHEKLWFRLWFVSRGKFSSLWCRLFLFSSSFSLRTFLTLIFHTEYAIEARHLIQVHGKFEWRDFQSCWGFSFMLNILNILAGRKVENFLRILDFSVKLQSNLNPCKDSHAQLHFV